MKKVIVGKAGETATFDLFVDKIPVPGLNDVAYPGAEMTVELPTGSHTVSETFGDATPVSTDWVVEWSDNCPNGVVTVVKSVDPTVCTVTNKRKPTLTVTKNVVGSQQKFEIYDGVTKLFTSAGASTNQTFTYVSEGTHAIGETLLGGGAVDASWDVQWAGDCVGTGHQVTLAWGDAKACTITNTKRPTLTITKNIVGTGSFDIFDRVGQPAALDNANLATQSVTMSYAAGTAVDVTETMSDGSTPVDTKAWAVVKTGDCKVTLAAGDAKSCTIDNKRRPTVLVKKNVVGGTAKPGDFTIGVGATNADPTSVKGSEAGTVVTVDPGTFQATETNPSPLYDVSYSAGCGQPQAVSVGFGDAQRTCTVTNTRKSSGITVTKTAQQTEIAEPGGSVMFDVVVHNDSTADTVTITTLTDDPDGLGQR